MQSKKRLWVLGLAMSSLLTSQLMATTTPVQLEYCNTTASISTNTIGGKIKLTNTSGTSINLADLKVRYYYTIDEALPQALWCDHAGLMGGNGYETVTSFVTSSFNMLTNPTKDADTYVEMGFKSGTAILTPNGTVELQMRITNSSWRNYDQSNDYSYEATPNVYLNSEHVTLYYKDVLISGNEPRNEGVVDAVVTPSELSYDKNQEVSKICGTKVTFNGNSLVAIKNNGISLKETDYSLDSTGYLSFNTTYLQSLAVGDYQMVVEFNSGRSAVIRLQVVDTTDYDFAMTVESVQLKAGEEMLVPIKLNNVAKGINNANLAFTYNQDQIEVEQILPGESIPNSALSFKSAIHQNKGSFNVLFASVRQDGSDLITRSGNFVQVQIKAKKDVIGTPFKVVSMKDIADVELKKINILFKVK